MSQILWIRGGRVLDPANNRDEPNGNLYAVDGVLVDSLSAEEKSEAEVIDATGQVVCPGLVDIHVHFREPGQTHKETIRSGTRAAAAGGFTTVVCMPNTSPPCDTAGTIQQMVDAIERDAVIHTYPTGTITEGMKGERLAPIGSLKKAGAIAITDDGLCVQNNELMRRAVEYAHMHGLVVLDHCQDVALTQGSVMHEGEWSLRLGLRGWPSVAEDLIVSRNVILAEYTGAPIHLQHISSAGAVEILRRARQRGVPVTAEATPHHLAMTDAWLRSYDTNCKMNPPVRTERDREVIIEAVLDGTLDCIATDHAPHTVYEKDVEFDRAPNGILGLETALPVCLGVLVHEGRCDLSTLVGLMTYRPARILGLNAGTLSSGAPADITIFDPEEEWTLDPERSQSLSRNSPWNGRKLTGRIKHTLVEGRVIWDGEAICEPLPQD